MEEDADLRLVWLRRLRVPFASLADLSTANDAVVQEMLPRHQSYGLVVDMRRALSRNDAAFEAGMQRLRSSVEARFARTAVLLATQVGMLQVNRLSRQDGATTLATTDEAAAVRFARGEPD
jgi:hypothetical protein